MPRRFESIEISIATEATDELVAAFGRMIPQLSASAAPPDSKTLIEVIGTSSNTLLLARDREHQHKIIGTLTLVVLRIPTGIRAWIEDVVVDAAARGRGAGEALTREAIRLASERGAQTIDLTSRRSREAAHKLYEKVGFTLRETSVYRFVGPRTAH